MKKMVIFLIAILVATFLSLVACMYLNDHLEAHAEEFERIDDFQVRELEQVDRSGDQLRSVNSSVPNDGIVRDNLLWDSSFVVFPVVSYDSPADRDNAIWFCDPSLTFSSISNDGGLSITSSADYGGMYQYFAPSWFHLGDDITVTICAKSTVDFYFTFSGSVNNDSTYVNYANSVWSSSSDYGVHSYTFQLNDLFLRYLFTIRLRYAGSLDIKWVKLELYDIFTGYVPNSYIPNGYNVGYNDGSAWAYPIGYDVGYSDGEYDGYQDGHEAGYNEGYDVGDSAGYSRGYASGQIYGYDNGYIDGVFDTFNVSLSYTSTSISSYQPWTFTGDLGFSAFGIDTLDKCSKVDFWLDTYLFDSHGFTNYCESTFVNVNDDLSQSYFDIRCYNSSDMVLDNLVVTFLLYTDSFEYKIWQHLVTVFDTDPNLGSFTLSGYVRSANNTSALSNASRISYSQGYDEGYSVGSSDGYSNGFAYASSVFSQGTWRSFFSALISVPVAYIRGFFDFEIFGFNFLSVFKTVIVLSLLVFCVKFILGKVSV